MILGKTHKSKVLGDDTHSVSLNTTININEGVHGIFLMDRLLQSYVREKCIYLIEE